jgi:hypothetical protein
MSRPTGNRGGRPRLRAGTRAGLSDRPGVQALFLLVEFVPGGGRVGRGRQAWPEEQEGSGSAVSGRRSARMFLARLQDIRPLERAEDLIAPIWESDDELEQFLADLYAARRAARAHNP